MTRNDEMRRRYTIDGTSMRRLAREYGVSRQRIGQIIHGHGPKEIEDTRDRCEVPGCGELARMDNGRGAHMRCWKHADVGALPTDRPAPTLSRQVIRRTVPARLSAEEEAALDPTNLPRTRPEIEQRLRAIRNTDLFYAAAARYYCQATLPSGLGCGEVAVQVVGLEGRCAKHAESRPNE
jgi:hypothetical protein